MRDAKREADWLAAMIQFCAKQAAGTLVPSLVDYWRGQEAKYQSLLEKENDSAG